MRIDTQVNLLTLRKISKVEGSNINYIVWCQVRIKNAITIENRVFSQVSPDMNGNLRFSNFNLQDFEHGEWSLTTDKVLIDNFEPLQQANLDETYYSHKIMKKTHQSH